MPTFKPFAQKVNKQLKLMSSNELFVTINGDRLWETYLNAFPQGTDPIYKTRSSHNCNCCRNFIRNLGNVVSINSNGELETVWDSNDFEYPYNEVAAALAAAVKNAPISHVFRTNMKNYGNAETKHLLADGTVKKWSHFYGDVHANHYTQTPEQAIGQVNSAVHVFKRGLIELTFESLATIHELIQNKLLYRGEEHLRAVESFIQLKAEYDALPENKKALFIWQKYKHPAAYFRNTVIGTLAVDLSDNVPLEDAVKMFESKVAPTNYKRPTALITQNMVSAASKEIAEMGLEPALERRFATIEDIAVNNVIWVNNSAKAAMSGVESLLTSAIATPQPAVPIKSVVNISIDEFMNSVLPNTTDLEMLVDSSHVSNFVSLTAPVHNEVEPLFKWDNNFAWSYTGEVTDSIKDRVKKAGGNVANTKLRISLAWFNLDDLDIHVTTPTGAKINYANKSGILDVDMNAFGEPTRSAVENCSFTTVRDGKYLVAVNNFRKRENVDVGCEIEVEFNGQSTVLFHKHALSGMTPICEVVISKNGTEIKIVPSKGVTSNRRSVDVWGVKTETFVKVDTLMFSPNYWDGKQQGNKHWFFMLNGCKNPEPVRGFYNEFLKPDLEKHRKVFEVLASKTKCKPVDNQLSGIGFSSTRNDNITVRASGKRTKTVYNVQF